MSLKTKEDGIEDAGRAETTEILRPQRAGLRMTGPNVSAWNPNDGKLDIATKSVVAATVVKTRGTNRECL
jgi:hypothetical protein